MYVFYEIGNISQSHSFILYNYHYFLISISILKLILIFFSFFLNFYLIFNAENKLIFRAQNVSRNSWAIATILSYPVAFIIVHLLCLSNLMNSFEIHGQGRGDKLMEIPQK